MAQFLFRFRIPRWPDPTSPFSRFSPAPTSSGRGISCTRLVKSTGLVKSNKMLQKVAKTGWELTKVARIGRSRSVYSQQRVAGGVGQSREPKLSVCCLHISAHPFLANNRPGAPVFGHCPFFFLPSHCTRTRYENDSLFFLFSCPRYQVSCIGHTTTKASE